MPNPWYFQCNKESIISFAGNIYGYYDASDNKHRINILLPFTFLGEPEQLVSVEEKTFGLGNKFLFLFFLQSFALYFLMMMRSMDGDSL